MLKGWIRSAQALVTVGAEVEGQGEAAATEELCFRFIRTKLLSFLSSFVEITLNFFDGIVPLLDFIPVIRFR